MEEIYDINERIEEQDRDRHQCWLSNRRFFKVLEKRQEEEERRSEALKLKLLHSALLSSSRA